MIEFIIGVLVIIVLVKAIKRANRRERWEEQHGYYEEPPRRRSRDGFDDL